MRTVSATKNRILLYGLDWFTEQHDAGMVCVKGNVRYRDAVYEGAAFCRLVASAAADAGAFGEFVRELNGCFAIVLQRDGALCAATDRLRSFPLCRTRFRDAWLVTDDLLRAMEDTGMQPEIDSGAMEQFLLSGFVIGQRTVFRDIFAVQAAEIVRLRDAETESERYFLYDPKMNVTPDPAEGVRTADTLFAQAIRRMTESAPDVRNWIVPLSGGHDSRLIVNYLYKAGIRNVVCYSYGVPENPQSRLSREVAEAFGYEWHFVEYTRGLFDAIREQGLLDRYFRFASCCASSMPHTQDFAAVYELGRRGILQRGDLFVPGHTLDFLAGSHLTPQVCAIQTSTQAAEAVQGHFSNWGSRRPDRALQREIGRILNDTGVSSNGFPECFDWQERQAKFIMHSLRVYEFFGYGWRTPWWDNDLTAFWQDMDVPAKLNRSFFFYGEKHGWLDAKLKGIPFENELCPPRASKPLSRRIIEAVPPSVLSRLLRATGYTRKFRINEGLHDLYGDIPIERLLAPFSVLPGYLRRHIAPYRKRLASQYDYHQVTLAYAIRWLFFGSVGR